MGLKEQVRRGIYAESVLAEIWCAQMAPGARAIEMGRFAEIDRLIVRDNEILHFLEIKTRDNLSSDYPTTIVKLTKHLAARLLMDTLHIPTFLLVVFADGARIFRLDEPPDTYRGISGHCGYRVKRGLDMPALFREYRLRIGEMSDGEKG